MENLYHLTYSKNAESIVKEGLIPRIGENGRSAGERRKRIFLCEKKDIPYWQILLGAEAAVSVNAKDMYLLTWDYSLFREYICCEAIPPERICSVTPLGKPERKKMEDLCLYCLELLSSACLSAAKYYEKGSCLPKEPLQRQLEQVADMLKKLDFTSVTLLRLKKKIYDIGKKGCPFCAYYKNTERRMWEQLAYYPRDDLTYLRMQIYMSISSFLDRSPRIMEGVWRGPSNKNIPRETAGYIKCQAANLLKIS